MPENSARAADARAARRLNLHVPALLGALAVLALSPSARAEPEKPQTLKPAGDEDNKKNDEKDNRGEQGKGKTKTPAWQPFPEPKGRFRGPDFQSALRQLERQSISHPGWIQDLMREEVSIARVIANLRNLESGVLLTLVRHFLDPGASPRAKVTPLSANDIDRQRERVLLTLAKLPDNVSLALYLLDGHIPADKAKLQAAWRALIKARTKPEFRAVLRRCVAGKQSVPAALAVLTKSPDHALITIELELAKAKASEVKLLVLLMSQVRGLGRLMPGLIGNASLAEQIFSPDPALSGPAVNALSWSSELIPALTLARPFWPANYPIAPLIRLLKTSSDPEQISFLRELYAASRSGRTDPVAHRDLCRQLVSTPEVEDLIWAMNQDDGVLHQELDLVTLGFAEAEPTVWPHLEDVEDSRYDAMVKTERARSRLATLRSRNRAGMAAARLLEVRASAGLTNTRSRTRFIRRLLRFLAYAFAALGIGRVILVVRRDRRRRAAALESVR